MKLISVILCSVLCVYVCAQDKEIRLSKPGKDITLIKRVQNSAISLEVTVQTEEQKYYYTQQYTSDTNLRYDPTLRAFLHTHLSDEPLLLNALVLDSKAQTYGQFTPTSSSDATSAPTLLRRGRRYTLSYMDPTQTPTLVRRIRRKTRAYLDASHTPTVNLRRAHIDASRSPRAVRRFRRYLQKI